MVKKGVSLGIISTKNKNFRPNDKITRAEALKIIMSLKGIQPTSTQTSFADVQIEWMIPYIEQAYELKIISGQSL